MDHTLYFSSFRCMADPFANGVTGRMIVIEQPAKNVMPVIILQWRNKCVDLADTNARVHAVGRFE